MYFPIRTTSAASFATTRSCPRPGIPQITAIMGMCVAGGAYLPVMTDQVLMTEGSGLFLAGPALVQAAIGQKYTAEELGGATMHAEISGTVDFKEPNDHLCIARLRSLVAKWGHGRRAPFDRAAFDPRADAPQLSPRRICTGCLTPTRRKPRCNSYDMHEVIARIVDRSEFDEYQPDLWQDAACAATRGSAALRWASSPTRSSHSRRSATPARSASSSAA